MAHYLDYKATIWFRIPIDSEESLYRIYKALHDGESPTGDFPDELYQDDKIEVGAAEAFNDTEMYITPLENDGEATIELYADDGPNTRCIWDNGPKDK